MLPVLFSLGPFKVYSYGLFIALGFFTAIFLIEKESEKKAIPPAKISRLCLITFIFALLGARAMYVLTNFSYYTKDPLEILMLHHGGLMFHGGIIAGFITAWVYLKKSKLPILPVLDIIMLYLPLGQAIGRIGCFLNGCCFGRESTLPWAIALGSETITRHPSQIYASLGSLIIFVILRLVSGPCTRRGSTMLVPGFIFSLYLILYPINRIIVEEFRADLPEIWMGFSFTQWVSVGIFIIGIIVVSVISKSWKSNSNIPF